MKIKHTGRLTKREMQYLLYCISREDFAEMLRAVLALPPDRWSLVCRVCEPLGDAVVGDEVQHPATQQYAKRAVA